ncbi:MAG TPA: exopolysaccharide biosynthesis polyprenyl glycosylphosphotransferase [Solirubrobacteraceae bacterium]|nr:exopolysaccharide biosynthesis polyprenyl glycosylphosphotransferase [Solirubrobacteraceae bacterium]
MASRGRARREIERRDAIFRAGLATADVIAAVGSLVLVGLVGGGRSDWLGLVAVPLVVVGGKLKGLYDRDEVLINKTTLDQAPELFQLATLYTLLVWFFDVLAFDRPPTARQLALLWGALFVLTVAARRLARWVSRQLSSVERCLFVGSDESFMRLQAKLEVHDDRAQLVGRMSIIEPESESESESDVVSHADQLDQLIDDLLVHRVVIEPNEASPQLTLDFVREANTTGIRISLLPRILEVVGSSIEVDDIDGLTLLGVRPFGLTRSAKILKRGFDILGSGVGLSVLAPVIGLITVLIRIDTPGPVIFRQTRIGRDGEPFTMLKFRTMTDGADTQKRALLPMNQADGLFKIADDPRITRVGRTLRGLSLDEIPQLVNVWRGDMSLVGPRPLVIDEDARILGLDRRRSHLKPGMTGPWQILASSRVPLAEMVKLDYLYVANWSVWADVKILVRTLPYILARRGM